MLKNHFLVAVRNISRNSAFSLINILGLALGISAALVVFLLVFYENSFDKFQAAQRRTYRVVSHIYFSGDSVYNSGVCVPLAAAVKQIPAVEDVILFFVDDITGRITVNGKDFRTREGDIVYADRSYTDLIGYRWLSGSPESALQQPDAIVLTSSRAEKYFPGLSPEKIMGREILYDDTIRLTVTGIVADIPQQTDFGFKEIVSSSTIYTNNYKKYYNVDNWDNVSSSVQLLLKMRHEVDIDRINAALDAIRYQGKTKDKNFYTDQVLQPLSMMHFDTRYGSYARLAETSKLRALGWVALALLLLACINFVNLTTAQTARRAKETGIRKTMGSTAGQLMVQFLSETFLLTLLAAVLSLIMAPLLIFFFRSFLPEGFSHIQLYHWQVPVFLLLMVIVITLISGIYPAAVLTRFQPVTVLKTQTNSTGGRLWVRKTLTVSQFMVAQFFIIATLVVSKQVHFSLNTDLGFRKDAIITVKTPFRDTNEDKRRTLKEKIANIPGVELVSMGNQSPIISGFMTSIFNYKDGKKEFSRNLEMRYGDSNYTKVYQLRVIAGRNLQTPKDSTGEWLMNENAVKAFGFSNPRDIIGKVIESNPVVGVVKNFNSTSMSKSIPALAIGNGPVNKYQTLHIQLGGPGKNAAVWKEAITGMEKAWNEVYTKEPFSYNFLDKSIEALYESERDTAVLLNWCAGIAFFISALGLLGLVIYTTNQRTREIGIRKILGATVWQMITLLTKDFMKLVGIAFVLVIPLAWWAMHNWLQSYVYRTSLSWWVFAVGGMSMTLLALVTMSFKTVRAALDNPVNALKSE
ncbi:MAG TPA: ABC transporter permease [Chitinophaga sp.]|uniref:ABC transporter permease n=1 Tax=Chitinophaga sp. TaxID=1869181 RepID=UPI002C87A6A7|nr:ABC transporter permease [Chitinophaga sp.]HVI48331.1 ABC transporter permease [Chitinophaga sp.]